MKNDQFKYRAYIVSALILIVGATFIGKLLVLQIENDQFKASAERNSTRISVIHPSRGLVYDRNDKIIAFNKAAYDLMLDRKSKSSFDTLELSTLLGIELKELKEDIQKARKQRDRYVTVVPHLTPEEYARINERLYSFESLYTQRRTLREYSSPHTASHFLGYMGEVTKSGISKDDYYQLRDEVGKTGIEYSYEQVLRGQKGVKYEEVDAYGQTHGTYRAGKLDKPAKRGADLHSTIDIELQQYAEALLNGKRGSAIAIEPSTGEILAFVSSPSYDLSQMTGRGRGNYFSSLKSDNQKPLLNRPVSGTYSPGSTFKMASGLAALQMGAIVPSTHFTCHGTASRPIRCTHSHGSSPDLLSAVENSCNPYFWQTFKAAIEKDGYSNIKQNYSTWAKLIKQMGFGVKLETDIVGIKSGNIPDTSFYNRLYPKWIALTIRSLSIGQGEILVTPLQLANYSAFIANRGFYIDPHTVKPSKNIQRNFTPQKRQSDIAPQHFETIIQGMEHVYTGAHGTAKWYNNRDLDMTGKTGTVENNLGEDHSMFIGFSPIENPQIAVCVIVENAGFGSTWAAPISTLLMEYYINGEIPSYHKYFEARMLNTTLIDDELPES